MLTVTSDLFRKAGCQVGSGKTGEGVVLVFSLSLQGKQDSVCFAYCRGRGPLDRTRATTKGVRMHPDVPCFDF